MKSKQATQMFSDAEAPEACWQLDDFKTLAQMSQYLESIPVFGEELWLDSLINVVEELNPTFLNRLFLRHQPGPPSTITEELSTRQLEKLRSPLYSGVARVLTLLELKSKVMFYTRLNQHSGEKQDSFFKQNNILYTYAKQLENYVRKLKADTKELAIRKKYLQKKLEEVL